MNLFQKAFMALLLLASLTLMVLCSPLIFLKNLFGFKKESILEPKNVIPLEWLREEITYSELENYFKEIFDLEVSDLTKHNLPPHIKAYEWLHVFSVANLPNHKIKTFDSGFSRGIAVLNGEHICESITLMNYRPALR